MAPIQPAHRTSLPTKSILKYSSTSPNTAASSKSTLRAASSSLFPTTKSDKRRIKHSALLSKVTKSHSTSRNSSSHESQRRRRPNKKLVTTLSSLAAALPSSDSSPTAAGGSLTVAGAPTSKEAAGHTPQAQVNVIRRKSVKSKPGALKRKQKMDNEERRRWGMNMAQLSGAVSARDNGEGVTVEGESDGRGDAQASDGVKERWAALRGFIGQTLERRADVRGS